LDLYKQNQIGYFRNKLSLLNDIQMQSFIYRFSLENVTVKHPQKTSEHAIIFPLGISPSIETIWLFGWTTLY
jgi:hypothetical protein